MLVESFMQQKIFCTLVSENEHLKYYLFWYSKIHFAKQIRKKWWLLIYWSQRQNLVIYGVFKNQHYVQPFYVVSQGTYHEIVHSMTW